MMFKIPSLNSTPMIQKIKFPLVFVFFLFLNILAYHNAIHRDIRYDQLNVYSGAQIPHFSDRVKYAFFQHGPDGPIMQPELTWFRPIPLLISWELFRLFGGQWHMINMVNILIITLTGFIFFMWVRSLFSRDLLAFSAAVLFCLHPVNGIWVNDYQGGVLILLFLCLMLLSTRAFLQYAAEQKGVGAYVISLVLFTASLLFHEIAVFLPVYIFLSVYFLGLKDYKRAAILLVPFVCLIFCYLQVRNAFLGRDSFVHEGVGFLAGNFVSYVATLIKVFMLYLGKLFSVQGIVISWCEPFVREGAWAWLLLGICLLGASVFGWMFHRRSIVFRAWMLMTAGFIPMCVGGMLSTKEGMMYESNWLFFTSIGYFVLMGWLVETVVMRLRRAGPVVLAGFIIIWLNVAWAYNNLYADAVKYALFYRANAPGFRMAHIFLCEAYYKAGKYDEAQEAILGAMAGDQTDFGIYFYLAQIDVLKGAYAAAEKNVQRSLELYPEYTGSYLLLGKIYEQQGNSQKAADAYAKALQLDSSLTEVRAKLSGLGFPMPE